ncbi:hypothetical protein ALC62_10701 [Cyphomyrmex costatus]|uniref:Uncharacterized protein n=1 Tax=Cyphomyrmex costatus TaxID=456900 RepID=A0A195CFB2_9HYME|nr:hypothetical protein ALC62_10701 [Cyphomyrmex costatus]
MIIVILVESPQLFLTHCPKRTTVTFPPFGVRNIELLSPLSPVIAGSEIIRNGI